MRVLLQRVKHASVKVDATVADRLNRAFYCLWELRIPIRKKS